MELPGRLDRWINGTNPECDHCGNELEADDFDAEVCLSCGCPTGDPFEDGSISRFEHRITG